MEFVGGDFKDHDLEMENVEWVDMKNIDERLTFKSDKTVWKQASEII